MADVGQASQKESIRSKIAYSLAIFGVLGFVVIIVILSWLIDAPNWSVWLAGAVIAAFSLGVGFAELDEDPAEDGTDTDEPDPDDNLVWKFDRPEGFWGWVRRFVSVWFTFAGMLILFNKLLLGEVFNASDSVKAWAGLVWLALTLALEFIDVVEVEPEAEEMLTSTRPGLAAQTTDN